MIKMSKNGLDKLLDVALKFIEEHPGLVAEGINSFVEDNPELVKKIIDERENRR